MGQTLKVEAYSKINTFVRNDKPKWNTNYQQTTIIEMSIFK